MQSAHDRVSEALARSWANVAPGALLGPGSAVSQPGGVTNNASGRRVEHLPQVTAQGPADEGDAPTRAEPTPRRQGDLPPLKGGKCPGQAPEPVATCTVFAGVGKLCSTRLSGVSKASRIDPLGLHASILSPGYSAKLLRHSPNGSQCNTSHSPEPPCF